MSGLSQGSAKLFITSSNLVIASSGQLFIYSSGHPGVKRNVLSGAFFFRHPDVFFIYLSLYHICGISGCRFGDVVRIGLY